MVRSEIRMVELDSGRGSEANRTRQAIIVSNNGANASATRQGRGVITVVPLTSNTRRALPFQVLLLAGSCGLDRDSKAQAEQVRSVDVSRVGAHRARVPDQLMVAVDAALRRHLDLTN
ncbi:MAG: type II toxin-antitoxin system PemK/MazF family toxin [Acidimicrobiales bacterium]